MRAPRTTLLAGAKSLLRRRLIPAWRAAARVACSGLLCAAAATGGQEPPPAARFRESVEVGRLLFDVRVVDSRGAPVLGLTRENFQVEIDGQRTPVEWVQWVDQGALHQAVEDGRLAVETAPAASVAAPESLAEAEALLAASGAAAPAPPPMASQRLVVFLFQRDLHGSRMPGLMRMRRLAARWLERLAPHDLVAVAVFDSHLRLWQDFSAERARTARCFERVIHGRPPLVDPGPEPSLAEHLDRARARRAASIESALLVLGEALEPLEGAKTVVLLGWGLGRLSGGRVVPEPDYGPAVAALGRARASVYALDVTEADYHDLQVGLSAVAEHTGGFYAKTHVFAEQALERLERAVAGYYTLACAAPATRGLHSLRVRLHGARGEVLAPATVRN